MRWLIGWEFWESFFVFANLVAVGEGFGRFYVSRVQSIPGGEVILAKYFLVACEYLLFREGEAILTCECEYLLFRSSVLGGRAGYQTQQSTRLSLPFFAKRGLKIYIKRQREKLLDFTSILLVLDGGGGVGAFFLFFCFVWLFK